MNPRVWVIGAGAGAGEAAFTGSFRRALELQGVEVVAMAYPEASMRVMGSGCAPLPSPESLAARASVERPDAVVFGCSLTCVDWIAAIPPGPLLASIEFTWVMWSLAIPDIIRRLSRMWVLLPPALFRQSLLREGGYFALDENLERRLVPVGWPEPAPAVAPAEEVLLYLGQRMPRESFAWAAALVPVIEQIAREFPHLRWRYVGDRDVALPCLVKRTPWLEPAAFREAIARAALVVCHHGMATIATAAAAGTPVVALSEGLSWRAGCVPEWSDQELSSLERGGVVRACYGRATPRALARRIRVALRAGRAERPEADGARAAASDLLTLIGARRESP